MSLNPFATVNDYPTMLNKIAWYTFTVSLGAVFILRDNIPLIENVLKNLNFQIPVLSGIQLPIGTVLPAMIVALFSRSIKFHDRISDVFKIRKRFDIYHILFPLALVSSSNCNVSKIDSIKNNRNDLMGKVFYKYASSSSEKAQIDPHYITMALDQWSWYWIVLEAISIMFIISITLIFFSKYFISIILLLLVLVGIGFLQLLKIQCSKYALQQVDQILSDNTRKLEVQGVFNAL